MDLMISTDMFRVIAAGAVARRASEIREMERDDLAVKITNRITEAWNKGQK